MSIMTFIYIYISLANLLIFYLIYFPAFYLAYLLAFYLVYLLVFYLTYFLTYSLAYLLTFYLANLLAFYLAVEIQWCPLSSEGPRLRSSGITVSIGFGNRQLRSSGVHCTQNLAVEVQPCPLRSEAGCWGPAVPTALRNWRLRSSRAHSDRKPAVEVQQCPLRAEVGEETGDILTRRKWMRKLIQIWSRKNWRWRKRRKRRRKKKRRIRNLHLIKSNNPYLTGGKLLFFIYIFIDLYFILLIYHKIYN